MTTVSDQERELLIEQVVSAHRQRDPRGAILPSAAFHDLDEAGRLASFDEALAQRRMEAALDPEGRSTTVRAVLAAIARAAAGEER